MKTKFYLALFILLAIAINSYSKSMSVLPFSAPASSVNVPVAGQLASLIDASEDSLIVTGPINTADFATIRNMPNLKYLNMEGAILVDSVIPDSRFQSRRNLQEIIFPKCWYRIGYAAFYDCTGLKKVTLNEGLQSIGNQAFSSCNALSELQLPSSLKTVGDYAFGYCQGLQNVTINAVTTGNYSFYDCNRLKQITFNEGVESIGYQAFYSCDSLTGSIVFPATLKTMGDYAFIYCGRLQEVTFNGGAIGYRAFRDCDGLKKATFNEGLESIGSETFQSCDNLGSSIVFPASLQSMGANAFQYCGRLQEVTFNGGALANYAFYDCNGLKKATFNEGVQSIGVEAFYACDSLAGSIVFPASLQSMGENAFRNCHALEEVNIKGGVLGNYAFYQLNGLKKATFNGGTIGYRAFYDCNNLETVTFNEGVVSIAGGAFQYCEKLGGSVVFPASLETIGDYAFQNCHRLTEVTFPNGASGSYAFYDCNGLKTVNFKEGVESLGVQAFYSNDALRGELIFPSTLKSIGSEAFGECYLLAVCRISATVPPVVGGPNFCGRDVATVFVPQGTGAAYRAADYWKTKNIVDGLVGVSITVELSEAGTMGEKILAQVPYLNLVNKLKVKGPMNDADFTQIKNVMTGLFSIDLSEATFTSIPNEVFRGKYGLYEALLPEGLLTMGDYAFSQTMVKKMVLPSTVTTIGHRCFYDCDGLFKVDFPEDLQAMGTEAFRSCDCLDSVRILPGLTTIPEHCFRECTSLKEVSLPNTLLTIAYCGFYSASGLESIVLPESVTYIGESAFSECHSLNNVVLPANLQTLWNYGFYNTQIASITLPASLTSLGYNVFTGALKKITCMQPAPPILTDDPFVNVTKASCELVVPSWSVNSYKLANIWCNFYPVSTYDAAAIKYLTVRGELALPDSARPTNKPIVSVLQNGKLSVRGEEAFSMNKFIQWHRLSYNYWNNNEESIYTSLVNESAAMRADTVCFTMTATRHKWYFISFPFDVKVSDIQVTTDAVFVIRKYDGLNRASKGVGSNWKAMTADSTLLANQGYIIQFDRDVDKFVVPALDNQNKNKLFTNVTAQIPLAEYPAAFTHNRSWNFVGNPFPCYFDINYIEFNAPITIWNGTSYIALSLVDDQYVLKPMQAFFVQKPLETPTIGFLPVGRQTVVTHIDRGVGAMLSMGSIEGRALYNLTLSNETYSDQTRVVINPQASLAYEITTDASKFMSDNNAVPQLFSIDDQGIALAINERPYASGIVKLGVYVGTEGTYTLALSNEPTQKVILIDKLLNTETVLTADGYLFTAAVGSYTDRFELKFEDVTTAASDDKIVKSEVYAQEDKIVVVAEGGSKIALYTETGILKSELVAQGSRTEIVVEPGVYLVQVNGEIFKVVVTR